MAAGAQGWRGTAYLRRFLGVLVAAVAAACAGGAPGDGGVVVPSIQLEPNGAGWTAAPKSQLKKVSNNGLGYTGQIDRYEMTVPATGRMQISLIWDHDANFDVIIARDDLAKERVAVGVEQNNDPEYVGLDVLTGEHLFLFVAGWSGDPGPYTIEILLLPPTTPLFALESAPDLTSPTPSNRPLTFTFTTELDPDQDFDGRVYLVHAGGVVDGRWCVDGRDLTFYPHLPETPGDQQGLQPNQLHVLQFPRAARGVRAVTGEYLTDLVGLGFNVAPPEDVWPGAPMVVGITPSPLAGYQGEAITIAISEPIDPASLAPQLVSVAPGGATTPLPFQFSLTQAYTCGGDVEVRLLIAPSQAPPPGTTTRLTLPPRVFALGGGPELNHGQPVTVDFTPP